MKRISAVYKIVNEVTGDFYIGSSKDVKRRWAEHKRPSVWNEYPNNPMYKDMQKYGVEKFRLQILVPVMPEYLKQVEQECIEMLKPTYNSNNAKGWDFERYKEHRKEYHQQNREKYQEYRKEHYQQNREKDKEASKKYNNQLCRYNGETLTLGALRIRFQKAGIEHPTLEAKKYLLLKT